MVYYVIFFICLVLWFVTLGTSIIRYIDYDMKLFDFLLTLSLLIMFIFGIVSFREIRIKEGFKKGQIQAINGKKKYEKVEKIIIEYREVDK